MTCKQTCRWVDYRYIEVIVIFSTTEHQRRDSTLSPTITTATLLIVAALNWFAKRDFLSAPIMIFGYKLQVFKILVYINEWSKAMLANCLHLFSSARSSCV